MSNLEIVLKKSGELRVYCDLREVNNAVIRESCVLPKVDDTLQAMGGSKSMLRVVSFSFRLLKNLGTLLH